MRKQDSKIYREGPDGGYTLEAERIKDVTYSLEERKIVSITLLDGTRMEVGALEVPAGLEERELDGEERSRAADYAFSLLFWKYLIANDEVLSSIVADVVTEVLSTPKAQRDLTTRN
mgnify:FL=1